MKRTPARMALAIFRVQHHPMNVDTDCGQAKLEISPCAYPTPAVNVLPQILATYPSPTSIVLVRRVLTAHSISKSHASMRVASIPNPTATLQASCIDAAEARNTN